MIDKNNPYASPQTEDSHDRLTAATVGRQLSVDSRKLIVPFGAQFPDRCVKCNSPAQGYKLRRDLAWHSSVLYLLLLLNILIYAVVAMAVRRKATVFVGLCPEHRSRRQTWQIVCAFAGVGAVSGLVAASLQESIGVGIASGVLLLVAIIVAIVTTPVVTAGRITDRHAEVRGCGREFLDSFPGWEGTLF